jgi:hypothetical protein
MQLLHLRRSDYVRPEAFMIDDLDSGFHIFVSSPWAVAAAIP